MTIELIAPIHEISSGEEFMTSLKTAFEEASTMKDEVKFTCTTLHRQDEGEGSSVLGLQVNGSDTLAYATPLTYDTVEELIDLCLVSFPDVQIPKFSRNQLSNVMQAVYGDECDEVDLSKILDTHVFKGSAYQGLTSEVQFTRLGSEEVRLTFTVAAEIFADTEAEERAFLELKGLDPVLCSRSSPNKRVPLMYLELHPLTSIHS